MFNSLRRRSSDVHLLFTRETEKENLLYTLEHDITPETEWEAFMMGILGLMEMFSDVCLVVDSQLSLVRCVGEFNISDPPCKKKIEEHQQLQTSIEQISIFHRQFSICTTRLISCSSFYFIIKYSKSSKWKFFGFFFVTCDGIHSKHIFT